jgi:tetratricopeptide (TPR) repeat protein
MRFLIILCGFLLCAMHAHAQSEQWKALEVEADTLMSRENYEGALLKYDQIIKATGLKDADTYFIYYKRGVCLYSLQRYEEALQDVEQFIKLQPDFHQAKLLKAFLGREMGDTQIQITSLTDLLQQDPKNLDLLKWRATTFVDAGMYAESRRDTKAAQNIHDDAELEGYMGISYYYESKSDSALMYFDKAIALDRSYLTSYLYAGSLCLDEEAYDLSLIYLNKGLQIDPTNVSLQFYKGIALVEKGDLIPGCRLLAKAFNSGIDDAGDYLKDFCYKMEE